MASPALLSSPLTSLLSVSVSASTLCATKDSMESGSPSPLSRLPNADATSVLSSPPPSPTRLDSEYTLAPPPRRSSRQQTPRKPAGIRLPKAQRCRSLTPKSKLSMPKSAYLLYTTKAEEVASDLALMDKLTLASELDRRAAQSKDYSLMSVEHQVRWRQAQTPVIMKELAERRRLASEADAAHLQELELQRELGERARQSAAYQHSDAQWKAKWRAHMTHKIKEEWKAAARRKQTRRRQREEKPLVFPVEETLKRQKLCQRFQALNRRYTAKSNVHDVCQAKEVAWKLFYADGQAHEYWQPYVFQLEAAQINMAYSGEYRGGPPDLPVPTNSGTPPPPELLATTAPGHSCSSSTSPTTPTFSPVWGSSPLLLSAERGTLHSADVLPGTAGEEQPVLLYIERSSSHQAQDTATKETQEPHGSHSILTLLIAAAAEVEAAMNEDEPVPVSDLESTEPSLSASTTPGVDSDGDIVMAASEPIPWATPEMGRLQDAEMSTPELTLLVLT